MSEIGNFLRQQRLLHKWTLKELAKHTGLSVSFLSQVERGISSPSILSLNAISKAMGIPLFVARVYFEQTNDDRSSNGVSGDFSAKEISTIEERADVQISSGSIKYQFLSGEFPGRQFEILTGEIPGNYHSPSTAHEGEEFGYVLEGELLLTIEDETYKLKTGDSYHFLATKRHAYEAASPDGVRILWVQTMKYFKWRQSVDWQPEPKKKSKS